MFPRAASPVAIRESERENIGVMRRRLCLTRLLWACAVLSAPLAAQRLATNDDGSKLWMGSGWYQAGDEPGSGESFIYHFDGAAWSKTIRSGTGGSVYWPMVRGNGRVVGWQRSPLCLFHCLAPLTATEFSGLDKPVLISRTRLSLSRNARFAVAPGYLPDEAFQLQDLETGRVWKTPEAPPLLLPMFGLADVADDGTVAAVLNGSFVRWRPGDRTPATLVRGRAPYEWGLSADGRRVWAAFGLPYQREELVWIDAESTTPQPVMVAPRGAGLVRMSASGGQLLYSTPDYRTLLVWDSTSRESRVLLGPSEPLRDAVLSGDGGVAWILAGDNRLLRMELASGNIETHLSGFPEGLLQEYTGVPGSALELVGFGAGAVEGLEIRLSDTYLMPVVDSGPSRLVVQVPWEVKPPVESPEDWYPGHFHRLSVRRPGHPFEQRGLVTIFADGVFPILALADPRKGDRLLKAAHDDFDSLVTPANPARPGETIHLWLFGLGPLDRPVPTGARGPADPPARPVAPLACYLLGANNNDPPPVGLRLPFVAYAPGLIGAYQVDATIPEAWPAAGVQLIRCESGGLLTEALVPVGVR